MPTQKPVSHRVFFALWPDQFIRQQISAEVKPLLKPLAGRPVPASNWHITLAFLGNVSEQVFEQIQQQADQLQANAFSLQLDHFGYWQKPRVAWLGLATMPDALQQLVSSLNTVLEVVGYRPQHEVYRPHMTLMRKAQCCPSECSIKPVDWSVNAFSLIESRVHEQGSTYTEVRRWPLV